MGAPVKDNVTYDDWDKLDIRVGTIERVDDVEGSKKLVALTVDFGDFKRTILTGLKEERANPKEIEGMQTLFLVNTLVDNARKSGATEIDVNAITGSNYAEVSVSDNGK